MLVVTGMVTNWPMQIRFHFSLPAFEQVAQGIRSGATVNTGPQWIGLYYVERIVPGRDEAIGFATGTDVYDTVFYYELPPSYLIGPDRPLTRDWCAADRRPR